MQVMRINPMNYSIHNSKASRKQDRNMSFKSIVRNQIPETLTAQGRKKLFTISAPSATGKDTIINDFKKKHPLFFGKIVTCTTRPPRTIDKGQETERKEKDSVDYNFLTVDEFKSQEADGKFVETSEVYPGQWYGVRIADIEKAFEQFDNLIMDVDVDGARKIRTQLANKNFSVVSIFINPPSLEILKKRHIDRGTKPEEIPGRLERVPYEIECGEKEFPVIIQNNDSIPENVRDLEELLGIN